MQLAYLRFAAELLIEELQLCLNGMEVSEWVWAAAINDMHQHPGTLAVAQELMPQSSPLVSTLQKPCQTSKQHS